MLINLKEIFKIANEKKIAIGAFNVPNYESARAIVEAAEETGYPVILNYAPVHSTFMSIEDAAELMLYFAKKASVPVCVHLDHGANLEICTKAIQLGFTSVMIDASNLSYEDNIKETQAVCRMSHSVDVTVEAELGHIFTSDMGLGAKPNVIEGVDNCGPLEDVYTIPEVAKDFVKATGVDCLAIAFGTSHGLYIKKPVLDLDRISKIKEAVDLPFVMHGGSGLSKEEFQTAIKNGIRKINYYTYMTLSGGKAIKEEILKGEENNFFHDLSLTAINAMKENVKNAILTFALEI